MKRSTAFTQAIFSLFALLTISFTASANFLTNIEPPGGTRSLIQLHSTIEITQNTPEHLSITIVDEDGVVVLTTTTDDASAVISTAELESGDYIVQTIDDDGDYQEYEITID